MKIQYQKHNTWEWVMNYEEAYDLMNDLHESLQAIDRGMIRCRRNHVLDGAEQSFILQTIVTKETR